MEFLKVLGNPDHPEYQSYRKWVGKRYNPNEFNPGTATNRLKQRGAYIKRYNFNINYPDLRY